jgi:hypothetical protein
MQAINNDKPVQSGSGIGPPQPALDLRGGVSLAYERYIRQIDERGET